MKGISTVLESYRRAQEGPSASPQTPFSFAWKGPLITLSPASHKVISLDKHTGSWYPAKHSGQNGCLHLIRTLLLTLRFSKGRGSCRRLPHSPAALNPSFQMAGRALWPVSPWPSRYVGGGGSRLRKRQSSFHQPSRLP